MHCNGPQGPCPDFNDLALLRKLPRTSRLVAFTLLGYLNVLPSQFVYLIPLSRIEVATTSIPGLERLVCLQENRTY